MKRSLRQILSLFPGLPPRDRRADGRADEPGPPAGRADADYDRLMRSIDAWFEREKPYLNPSLTVADVAAAVRSNRSYVSRAINVIEGRTFYELVNDYRFRYFMHALDSAQAGRYTLEAIARRSGFGSMTTLYGIFRTQKGCTPKQYIRSSACKF